MADDVKTVLLSEQVRLERKLAKIKALLMEYDDEAVPERTGRATIERKPAPMNPRGQPNSLTSQIMNASAAYLRQTGARAATSELTTACLAAGVPLPGDLQKQRDYVSSILSHSSAFNNVRGEGYGLAEWPVEQKATPDDGAVDPPQGKLLAPKPNGHLETEAQF